jgi:hypothetical protein
MEGSRRTITAAQARSTNLITEMKTIASCSNTIRIYGDLWLVQGALCSKDMDIVHVVQTPNLLL